MCQPAWEAHEAARMFRRNCQQQWGNEDFAEDKEAADWWSGVWLTPHLVQQGDKGMHCTMGAFHNSEKPEVHWWTEWMQGKLLRCSRKGVNSSAWFKVYNSFKVPLMATQVLAAQNSKMLQAFAQELPQLWSQLSSPFLQRWPGWLALKPL